MEYAFLALSVAAAVVNNILLHLPAFRRCKINEFLFNIGVAAVWAALLLAFNLGIHGCGGLTFLFAALYGCVLAGFLFCKMQAFVSGPIHLTSLVGSSSFVLTTVFNAVYWKEAVSGWQIAGIVLMLAAVFLITYRPQAAGRGQKLPLRWKVYAAGFFFFSALTGVVFRFHQTYDAPHTNEMMIFSSVAVMLFLALLWGGRCLYGKRRAAKKGSAPALQAEALAAQGAATQPAPAAQPVLSGQPVADVPPVAAADRAVRQGGEEASSAAPSANGAARPAKRAWVSALFVLACGAAGCVYNRTNIYLSGAMPNAVFFPLFNGGNILLSTLLGCLLFREKLTLRQIVGMLGGVAAIVLVSNCFGLL